MFSLGTAETSVAPAADSAASRSATVLPSPNETM